MERVFGGAMGILKGIPAILFLLLSAGYCFADGDPAQMFLLKSDSIACKHEDDIRMLEYYMERDDKKMLLFMVKEGRCWFSDRSSDVRIKKTIAAHPTWVQVQQAGEERSIWVFGWAMENYMETRVLPSLAPKADMMEKHQQITFDALGFRNEKSWQTKADRWISEHKISVGMTKDQILSSWGEPKSKESRLQPGGSVQIWNYANGYSLSFSGDILTIINKEK
jgi:hypothetical protein